MSACETCGRPLKAKRKDARFCCNLCCQRAWWRRNRQRGLARARDYKRRRRELYPHLVRAQEREANARVQGRASRNLSDGYVKQVITQSTGLSRPNIPRVLIEAKRAQLMLMRLANQREGT